MRTGWRRSALAGAGALTCVVALGAASQAATSTTATESASSSETASEGTGGGTTADLAEAQTSSEGVEVRTLGTVTVRPYQSAENPPAVLAVHGVQRVDGATVVYWSAGYADGGAASWRWREASVCGPSAAKRAPSCINPAIAQ